jgi:AcrR family transcriptional regulator
MLSGARCAKVNPMDPRAERTRTQALDAARTLLIHEGIDAVTHLRLAEASGVARRTLYRHWPDQSALLLDMLAVQEVPHAVPTGDVRNDLVDHLVAFSAALHRGHLAHVICAIGERAATHPEFEPLRAQLTEAGCAPLRRILKQAVRRKVLPGNLHQRSALAALEGPILYEAIMHRRSVTQPIIEDLVDRFLAAPPIKTRGRA